jgi:hypothetical protein
LKWALLSFVIPTVCGVAVCFLVAGSARLIGLAQRGRAYFQQEAGRFRPASLLFNREQENTCHNYAKSVL